MTKFYSIESRIDQSVFFWFLRLLFRSLFLSWAFFLFLFILFSFCCHQTWAETNRSSYCHSNLSFDLAKEWLSKAQGSLSKDISRKVDPDLFVSLYYLKKPVDLEFTQESFAMGQIPTGEGLNELGDFYYNVRIEAEFLDAGSTSTSSGTKRSYHTNLWLRALRFDTMVTGETSAQPCYSLYLPRQKIVVWIQAEDHLREVSQFEIGPYGDEDSVLALTGEK